MISEVLCWCDKQALAEFSEKYWICQHCHTITLHSTYKKRLSISSKNQLELNDLKRYSDILLNSRTDLTDKYLFLLLNLLTYQLAPNRILELGTQHGGLLALLKELGFDARGQQTDSVLANYARSAFNVAVSDGCLEMYRAEAESFDTIIMADGFERLDNPVDMIKQQGHILSDKGIIFIKLLNFPENKTFQELLRETSSFINYLELDFYNYFFTQASITQLLAQEGFNYIDVKECHKEEDKILIIASRYPLAKMSEYKIDEFLQSSAQTRLIRALFDLFKKYNYYDALCNKMELHNNTHQDIISQLYSQLKWLNDQLHKSEIDRLARLTTIQQLTAEFQSVNQYLQSLEQICAERLVLINKLDKDLQLSQQTSQAWQQELQLSQQEFSQLQYQQMQKDQQLDQRCLRFFRKMLFKPTVGWMRRFFP